MLSASGFIFRERMRKTHEPAGSGDRIASMARLRSRLKHRVPRQIHPREQVLERGSARYGLNDVLAGFHADAVGTTITDRPPHRTVRARLRIRLPPWMGGEEAFVRIRMQNAGCWNPVLKDRSQPIPQCAASLTAAAQDQPPQTPKPLGEDV
jgi:hypothetical protein